MAHSFGTIRLGATALLITAALATGACGGDDSGGGDETKTDSGTSTGNKDSGVADSATPGDAQVKVDAQVSDGGGPIVTIGDAGATELAAALDPAGTNVTARRAELVFSANCERAKDCDDSEWTPTCSSDGVAAFQAGVDNGYDDTCLDATLDNLACYATVATCDDYFGDGCDDLEGVATTACAKYEDDAGTGDAGP